MVELSESERRSGWKLLASVLGDAAAAFGCVNRVEELVKQFPRGAVAKLLARPSVQFISCSQDILSGESLNGHALRNEGSKQPVVAFVLGTFPRGVGMRKVDCTAPALDLTERRELRAVVHGSSLDSHRCINCFSHLIEEIMISWVSAKRKRSANKALQKFHNTLSSNLLLQ